MHIRARHYATGKLIDIHCNDGTISSIGDPDSSNPDHVADYVAPAFFDLQINGCDGRSFNSESLTVDSVRHVASVCRSHGIGGFCPTLITNSFEALAHGFSILSQACDSDTDIGKAIPCFHLEGPYISPEDGPRGAHPRKHVRPPSWDEFQRWQEAARGRIRLVTLAPEVDGALEFIERLAAAEVVVALAHTAASSSRIRDAVSAGARLSTHLGNGSHAVLPRHDNYIWEQLAADELWASIICDGHHLPPAVVKCILRVKTPRRTILTCDASSLAGLPPGKYQEWGQELEILPEGKVVVPGTSYLAGSWAFTDWCINKAMQFTGVSLQEAVDMACARPRELLGLPPRRLEAGQPAELLLLHSREGDLRVSECIV